MSQSPALKRLCHLRPARRHRFVKICGNRGHALQGGGFSRFSAEFSISYPGKDALQALKPEGVRPT